MHDESGQHNVVTPDMRAAVHHIERGQRTVSLSAVVQVLTIMGFIAAALVWWSSRETEFGILEARVRANERSVANLKVTTTGLHARSVANGEGVAVMTSELKGLRRDVDRMMKKLDQIEANQTRKRR